MQFDSCFSYEISSAFVDLYITFVTEKLPHSAESLRYITREWHTMIHMHLNQRCPWIHFLWPNATQPINCPAQPNQLYRTVKNRFNQTQHYTLPT